MPVSRSGKRYAAGSHKTLGGWEPKCCSGCGERVYTSSKVDTRATIYEAMPVPQSWHFVCWIESKRKHL